MHTIPGMADPAQDWIVRPAARFPQKVAVAHRPIQCLEKRDERPDRIRIGADRSLLKAPHSLQKARGKRPLVHREDQPRRDSLRTGDGRLDIQHDVLLVVRTHNASVIPAAGTRLGL
jgi:hypothetical protein